MSVSLQRQSRLHEPLHLDFPILAASALLLVVGLIMIYSTTGVVSQERFGDAFFYVKRQGAAILLGIIALCCLLRCPSSLYLKISPALYPICVLLLILPLVPGLGDSSGGASRWVQIGGFRFQPGEIVKLLFIIYMSGYFARHEYSLGSFIDGFLKPMALMGSIAFLYLCEPDFGSTVVVASITFALAICAGVKLRYLLVSGALAAISFVALIFLSPYRMARVTSFLSPWEDASGKGYQLIQSLIAVGSGEMLGVGLGDSKQKLFFLPAAHTDFIYAVIAEEFGFLGAVMLLALFLFLFSRGVRLSLELRRKTFHFCLALGMTLLVVVPALLNMGVVIGVLPTKGMVLPLVGYGGTSVLSCLMAIGILLGLARERAQGRLS